MNRTISLAASLSLAWLLCSLLSANAEDVPRRKAGLWELTTIGAGSGTNKAKTCIGENDKILSPEGVNCTEPKVTKGVEDTVIGDVVCTKSRARKPFTCDFSTRYRAQVKMTFDPPPKGMLPYMGVTIDGTYLGPDCGAEKAQGEAK